MVAGKGTESDIETMLDICDNILGRSFCALGDGAVSPIVSGIKYFRDEFLALCDRGAKSVNPALVGAKA
jgi:NADH-quinone oxidoreductase subunit F